MPLPIFERGTHVDQPVSIRSEWSKSGSRWKKGHAPSELMRGDTCVCVPDFLGQTGTYEGYSKSSVMHQILRN